MTVGSTLVLILSSNTEAYASVLRVCPDFLKQSSEYFSIYLEEVSDGFWPLATADCHLWKCISTVICTGTGVPSLLAGENLHVFTVVTALSWNASFDARRT